MLSLKAQTDLALAWAGQAGPALGWTKMLINLDIITLTVSTFARILCPKASMCALNLSSSSVSLLILSYTTFLRFWQKLLMLPVICSSFSAYSTAIFERYSSNSTGFFLRVPSSFSSYPSLKFSSFVLLTLSAGFGGKVRCNWQLLSASNLTHILC